MNRRRILAVIMSVFMMLSLLPVAVFGRYNSRCTGWTVKDSGICSSRYYIKRRYAGDKKRRNNRGQCQLPMVS